MVSGLWCSGVSGVREWGEAAMAVLMGLICCMALAFLVVVVVIT
jgi:hypothetical protein